VIAVIGKAKTFTTEDTKEHGGSKDRVIGTSGNRVIGKAGLELPDAAWQRMACRDLSTAASLPSVVQPPLKMTGKCGNKDTAEGGGATRVS
jgi:hypothetical protein